MNYLMALMEIIIYVVEPEDIRENISVLSVITGGKMSEFIDLSALTPEERAIKIHKILWEKCVWFLVVHKMKPSAEILQGMTQLILEMFGNSPEDISVVIYKMDYCILLRRYVERKEKEVDRDLSMEEIDELGCLTLDQMTLAFEVDYPGEKIVNLSEYAEEILEMDKKREEIIKDIGRYIR
jgi:hypothetical protein